MNKRKLKKQLTKAEGKAKQWRTNYFQYQKNLNNGQTLASGATERHLVLSITGGFLLAERNTGGGINAPIRFYATPDELCEALKRELAVQALTK